MKRLYFNLFVVIVITTMFSLGIGVVAASFQAFVGAFFISTSVLGGLITAITLDSQ